MVVQQEDKYQNFINSIKSDITKKIYEYNLRLFMEICGIKKFENLVGQQNQIIPYLMSLREKKLAYNSICTRLNAIYHFYDMNDITLNKKKIKILKDELLRCDMPKSFEAEEYFLKGYVYLTTDPKDAIIHGLSKSILDEKYLDPLEKTLNLNYRIL